MDNFEMLNDLVARKRKALATLPQSQLVKDTCIDCFECGARAAIEAIENREIERKVKDASTR